LHILWDYNIVKSKTEVAKMTTYKRPIDELGRIVIPLEMRRKLDWKEKDIIKLHITDGTVILIKSYNYL